MNRIFRKAPAATVLAASLALVVGMTGTLPAAADTQVRATTTVSATVSTAKKVVKVTTSAVNFRRGPGTNYAIIAVLAKGSLVSLTGNSASGFSKVSVGSQLGWVSSRYLATPPVVLPRVIGTRRATANLLVRSTYKTPYKTIAHAKKGATFSVTGVIKAKRAQIIYRHAVRWVTARYLTKLVPAKPVAQAGASGVEKGLTANAVQLHRAAMLAFPQITTYYGVRPDSLPDHPSGHALDLMIPGYTTAAGQALGLQVAAWAQANQAVIGIEYVIFNQHIWSIARAGEGWRLMADRGSDSANHKNHVHVTVLD